MIASRLHHRTAPVRFLVLCLALLVLTLSLGTILALAAAQIMPTRGAAIPSICVSAPSVAPIAAPMVSILTIRPQPVVAERQPIIEPKRVKVRNAKSVHGRIRSRFVARE